MPKTALITGASSGLGLELTKLFAHDRYNLVVVARDKKRLDALAGDLKQQYGVETKVIAKDLTAPHAAQEIFIALQQEGIQLDALVNNAGFNEYGRLVDTDFQKELQIIQLNIVSYTELVKLFLPGMIKKGAGRILNLGSVGSFAPCPNDAVYCAAKAYVLSFSEAIAEELRGTGVTVTTLCPGATATEFSERAGIENVRAFQYKSLVMDARQVARIGYNAMLKGRTLVVAGMLNKATITGLRLTPRCIVRKFMMFMMDRAAVWGAAAAVKR